MTNCKCEAATIIARCVKGYLAGLPGVFEDLAQTRRKLLRKFLQLDTCPRAFQDIEISEVQAYLFPSLVHLGGILAVLSLCFCRPLCC